MDATHLGEFLQREPLFVQARAENAVPRALRGHHLTLAERLQRQLASQQPVGRVALQEGRDQRARACPSRPELWQQELGRVQPRGAGQRE